MSEQHTSLPWEAFTEDGFSGWYAIRQKSDDGLNHEVGSGDGGFEKEDAEFIVKAVNSHDELVKRLTWAIQFIETYAKKAAGPATPELNKCKAILKEINKA